MKSNAFATQFFTKLLFLLFLTAFATGLSAQVKLSVQGLVKKSDGTALEDKNYDLTFRFYDAETGGAALATETVTTEINGGVYSAILGGGGGLDMLPFDVPYFVSVAVDGGTELLPRIALSAAPYAISLQGSSNKFPSAGLVKTDSIKVAGAANVAGTTNTGNLFVNGYAHSNQGFFWHNNGTGQLTGMALGDKTARVLANNQERVAYWSDGNNYYKAPSGSHIFQTGNVQVDNNLNVNGAIQSGNKIITNSTGGFTFSDAPGFNTGLFPNGPGECQLRNANTNIWLGNNIDISSNNNINVNANRDAQLNGGSAFGNQTSILVGGAIVMNVGGANSNFGQYYMQNMKPKTGGGSFKTVQINIENGVVQYDNSTRRYKYNIQPLEDDFSLILKSQPRIYTRQPNETFTEIGYIAEEMDSIGLTHLVQRDKNGVVDGFDYTKMVLYTVEVLKTQHADIEKLKAEVAALTAEKNAIRTENTSLRTDAQNQQANFGKQLDELSRRLKSLETAASNR